MIISFRGQAIVAVVSRTEHASVTSDIGALGSDCLLHVYCSFAVLVSTNPVLNCSLSICTSTLRVPLHETQSSNFAVLPFKVKQNHSS